MRTDGKFELLSSCLFGKVERLAEGSENGTGLRALLLPFTFYKTQGCYNFLVV